MNPTPAFLQLAEHAGIVFDSGDLERLGRFLDLLLEANTRFNLTRIADPAQAWERHVFDSLTLLPFIDSDEVVRVIDVGAGGGLPGVPLAIVLPEVRFTLLEATGKKATFLEETIAALGLGNATVVNERAEVAGRDREHHREAYDAVLARAVGPLPVLLELTAPFATTGGLVLAIKGERAADEIAASREALHRLHCRIAGTTRTPTGTIVAIEKLRTTPKIYPRRPGEPKRAPIGGTPSPERGAPNSEHRTPSTEH